MYAAVVHGARCMLQCCMLCVVCLRRLAGAQYNLAMSLLKGVGVAANADEATYWFQKAAAQVSVRQYCASNLVPLTRI